MFTQQQLDLFTYFQKDLLLLKSWYIPGTHYSQTLETWLRIQDQNKKEALKILEDDAEEKGFGREEGRKSFYRFRVFYMACGEVSLPSPMLLRNAAGPYRGTDLLENSHSYRLLSNSFSTRKMGTSTGWVITCLRSDRWEQKQSGADRLWGLRKWTERFLSLGSGCITSYVSWTRPYTEFKTALLSVSCRSLSSSSQYL